MIKTYTFGNITLRHECADGKHKLSDNDGEGPWVASNRVLTYEKYGRYFAFQLLTMDLPTAFEIKAHDEIEITLDGV